ncbi:MAG: hypothetical protein NTX82_03175 [Candidatus Parcubacteria bacterium]|nr:hypothetical protein [Candidatus Parcubacteria bacterium]
MTIKNTRYCPIMKLTCDYFDICNGNINGYDFKKIKKVFKNLNLDYILLTQTKRKVIKQELLTLTQAKYLVNKYNKLGLKVVVVRYKDNARKHPPKQINGAEVIYYKNKQCVYGHKLKKRNNIVIAAASTVEIKRFIQFENSYTTNPKACLGMGLYLGYPACCVKNHYKNVLKNGKFDEVSIDRRWMDNKRIKNHECPLVNNIWPLFMHYFCNFKCRETYDIAKQFLDFCHENINKDFERWYFYYIKRLGEKFKSN